MAEVTFTIPSILNGGGGERKATVSAARLDEAFGKVSGLMGDDFARRVLNADGTPRALINIYVNGKNSKFADGMNTELKDNDEVYLLPAVAGGSDLSGRELDRYSRQVMLEEIGYGGQLKLRAARVCIVGTGGLGNPIAARLVAMGVGRVRLVDRDVIELSNLHRQTLFGEDDVGRVKVEAAADHLRKMNSDVRIEPLAVSVNRYNAPEVVDGCDVVIDALDSVDARYALNQACVAKNIPFVTGAAVGVSGQAFTILPGETACYYCMFPELDEDSMPTCSIEGVHPPILSIIGAIEVAEAVSVILGRKPALSDRIMHVDLGTLDFSFTRTFRAPECHVCGSGRMPEEPTREMIVEELCGRNRGSRTFSLTPTRGSDLDVESVIRIAGEKGFTVENQGELGVSVRTRDLAVSFMKRGSAVVVGPRDEDEALGLYYSLLGVPPEARSG
jgi:adenylyltransferase/sulfurtransferase